MTSFRSTRPTKLLTAVLLVASLLATTAATAPAGAQAAEANHEPPEPAVREMVFPVVGPTSHSDTWGACRGYRCSRSHKGVDIFGHKLAPLVAAVDGTIVSVRRSALTSAGNKVVVEDDEGWLYLYLHLNNDSPGTDDGANPEGWIIPNRLRVGDRVTAGQVIGYLGDSGNAERTPAHVHFEVHQPRVGAINPTPGVDAAQAGGRLVRTASLASTAAGRAEHEGLISAWHRALLKREPTRLELFAWADRFDIGFADRDDLIADLTMHPQRWGPSGTVMRSFQVAVGRRPSIAELRAWEVEYRAGLEAEAIVGVLLDGADFRERYGSLDDQHFIDVIYTNARGRAPASSVRSYWLGQLANGRARSSMAEYFVESSGLKGAMWHDVEVIQAFRAALDRLPSDAEFDQWVKHLDDGGLIVDIVDGIKN